MPKIDLVADLGESFGVWTTSADEAILDLLTSANIACGFHAGDPRTMDATVARERGVAIGAHPSFADLVGFGRRAMDLTVVACEEAAEAPELCRAREDAEAGYIRRYHDGETPLTVSGLADVLRAKGLTTDVG